MAKRTKSSERGIEPAAPVAQKKLKKGILDEHTIAPGHIFSFFPSLKDDDYNVLYPNQNKQTLPLSKAKRAKFKVIATLMAGGGPTGYGREEYGDGLNVIAQLVNTDGRSLPIIISFYMDASYSGPKELKFEGFEPDESITIAVDNRHKVVISKPLS